MSPLPLPARQRPSAGIIKENGGIPMQLKDACRNVCPHLTLNRSCNNVRLFLSEGLENNLICPLAICPSVTPLCVKQRSHEVFQSPKVRLLNPCLSNRLRHFRIREHR